MKKTDPTVKIKDIRRELFYFGSNKSNKSDETIQVYTYDGIREAIKQQQSSDDTFYYFGSGKGDFNGKQIVFEMMRYLLAIFMFSIHPIQLNPKKRAHYEKEINDYKEIFKILEISFTGSNEDFWAMRAFMTSNLTDFYGDQSRKIIKKSTTPQFFYNIELTSKPLIYLLYFFTGFGGTNYLIKDFKRIAQSAEEISYNKQQFIKQSAVALYREDFLLTMMLEALSDKATPTSIIDSYNKHRIYYNNSLMKDNNKGLSQTVTGYNPDTAYGIIKSEVTPRATLIPENYYSGKQFPNFITELTEEEKIKIIEIISNLYDLAFDETSLQESIDKLKVTSNIDRVNREYNQLKSSTVRDSDTRSWKYFIADDKDFIALQAFWSINKDLHLVFNPRILEILKQFKVKHPFLYVDIY